MEKEKLYHSNGYFNFRYMRKRNIFNWCWGGRGTGKTYGAIQELAQDTKPFIYLRRTQIQADLVLNPKMTPFKVPLSDIGITFETVRMPDVKNIYVTNEINDKGETIRTIAYTMALSTFANIRGFDAIEIEEMVYDEYEPEKHAKKIRNEADAFFNCYETINRNRELQGKKPLIVYGFSNSDNAICPIFTKMGLLAAVLTMSQTHEVYRQYTEKGVSLYNLCNSPISLLKRDTALYKATAGTEFNKMALDNEFVNYNTGDIKSYNLKSLIPMMNVGEICIYKIKNARKFYLSTHKMKTEINLTSTDIDLQRFRVKYIYLWMAYLNYNVIAEDAISEQIFLNYMEK